MVKFPMQFEVEASAGPGAGALWAAHASHLNPIECAIPVEFMGPGGGYSPEDFFALAVVNCVIALYKVYCDKSKIYFSKIKGKAVLTIDRPPANASFVMTNVDLTFEVSGASNQETAKALLEAAIRDCPVGNSIKSGKTFHIAVS